MVAGISAVEPFVAAERVDRRHLALLGGDGPQAEDQPVVLGHVARGEHPGHAGLHAVVDEHAAVDRDAGVLGELGVGTDTDGGQEDVAGHGATVLEQ